MGVIGSRRAQLPLSVDERWCHAGMVDGVGRRDSEASPPVKHDQDLSRKRSSNVWRGVARHWPPAIDLVRTLPSKRIRISGHPRTSEQVDDRLAATTA